MTDTLSQSEVEALCEIADFDEHEFGFWCEIGTLSAAQRAALHSLASKNAIDWSGDRLVRISCVGLCLMVIENHERSGSIDGGVLYRAASAILDASSDDQK